VVVVVVVLPNGVLQRKQLCTHSTALSSQYRVLNHRPKAAGC